MAYLAHECVRQASALEGAVYATLTGPTARNIVAFTSNALSVYSLVDREDGSVKMVLEAHVPLYGSVKDVGVVRLAGSTRDALVVSFATAKFTVCEWDPDTAELKTLSMHYYETEDLKLGFSRFHLPPKVIVDPAMRCAAMIVLDRHVAVIPFSGGGDASDAISALYGMSAAKAAKTQDSWVLPVPTIVQGGQLIDVAFLHDYFQPTILFLFESRPTWSGRALAVWNTRTVVAVSLDMTTRKWNPIWHVVGLGNDVHSIWPAPSPVGGAVLLAANMVYYVNQTTRYAMAINIHGTVNPPDFPHVAIWHSADGVVLDAAKLCFVSVTQRYASALISDKRGVLYVMNLMVGGSTVDSIELVAMGASSVASRLCLIPGGHVFLASRLGDSLLLKCDDASTSMTTGLLSSSLTDGGPSAAKRQRGAGEANDEEDALYAELFAGGDGKEEVAADDEDGVGPVTGMEEQDREDLQEAALEAQAEASAREASIVSNKAIEVTAKASVSWRLSVADMVMSVPITSVVIAPSLDAASLSNADELQGNPRHLTDIVACSGVGKSGCLAVLQQSARPDLFLSFPIGFVNAAWALYRGKKTPFHQYLVLSRRRGTTLLSTATQELLEIEPEDSVIQLDTPTVGMWSLTGPSDEGHSRLIQVTKHEVRLCNGHEELVQMIDCRMEDPKAWITSASFAAGVLVALRRNGRIMSWRYNAERDELIELPKLDEREEEAPWGSCYVYLHPKSAHASWHVLNEDQLTMQTLVREMHEQGKGQAEIEEMLGGSLADMEVGGAVVDDHVFVIAARLSGAVEFWLQEGDGYRLVYWTMGFTKVS